MKIQRGGKLMGNGQQPNHLKMLFNKKLEVLISLILSTATDCLHPEEVKQLKKLQSIANRGEKTWKRLPLNTAYDALFFILYGFRPTDSAEDLKTLVIARAKIIVDLIAGQDKWNFADLFKIWEKTTLIGNTVSNPVIGARLVTLHSWQRFYSRNPTNTIISEILKKNFTDAFELAVPEKLSGKALVDRLIQNKFEPVLYLRCAKRNLRFVVHDYEESNGNKGAILTVEVPLISRHHRERW